MQRFVSDLDLRLEMLFRVKTINLCEVICDFEFDSKVIIL